MKVSELKELLNEYDDELPILMLGEASEFFYGELEADMISLSTHPRTGYEILKKYHVMEKPFPVLKIGIKEG